MGDWQPQSLHRGQPSSRVADASSPWKEKAKAVPEISRILREEVALKRSSSLSAKRPLKGHRSQGTSLGSQTSNGEPRVECVCEYSVVSDSL